MHSSAIQPQQYFTLLASRFRLKCKPDVHELCEACNCESLDPAFFQEVLHVFEHPDAFDAGRFREFSIDTILDYLRKTHDYYLQKRIPELEISLDSLARIHPANSLLALLKRFFVSYKKHLRKHIEQEETKLFPLIEAWEAACDDPEFEPQIRYSLEQFERDHDHQIEEDLAMIRSTLEDYHPEVLDQMEFSIFLTQIISFERDLHVHNLIEELVLIPLADEIEARYVTRNA